MKGVNWDQKVAKGNFVCFLFSWSMGLDMVRMCVNTQCGFQRKGVRLEL